ncbi:twitching motility protein PilT [Egibacter rhizosphaerae]|uniref:Twitching motility protein PilT n=1 Tax=Egibacter rhizosphaerae TaxID=1670831 RepID=A0A411YK92_9ACTN|nr:Mut7-C RNAse domain-containing protein [Egibacter rhizosphaerae]QBI21628.1 twitching motility protein PilT [Egibacter rhizosphaerae]
MAHATIRFYADLGELAAADRHGEVAVATPPTRSVKDAIESCGVPHTEVDLVLVNGEVAPFDARLRAGDRVAAYPPLSVLDVDSPVRPAPRDRRRLLLDVHLGRLAERLRLLGLDAAYEHGADDAELATRSGAEQRWLLTRDRGPLMRAEVTHGYLVRALDPVDQTVEVVRRFDLADELAPFTRCARCNAELADTTRAAVWDRLPPAVRTEPHRFRECPGCGAVYWDGSHMPSLEAFVARVRQLATPG